MKPKIIRASTISMSVWFVERMLPELKKKYEMVLLSSPGMELDNAEKEYGVRGIRIHMERHISLKNDIVSLWKLIKVFRKEKPTMVHSMTPKAGLLCMIAAWITRVPVRVHTFTGLVFPTATGLKKKILMLTDSITCACATHVIPEGEGVKNDLLNNRITKKPLKVLGYGSVKGVDLKKFSPSARKNTNIFTFLLVGRVVRDKGINELVGAFVRLHRKYTNIKLVLVGPYEDEIDPISKETRQLIEDCEAIKAVGLKLGEELVSCYSEADCYVFPSYREGFPNTVLEAGAMGLPCIVTDINGSREIIQDGINGVIIPPKDEQALFVAMEMMLNDDETRHKMASNARKIIAERYHEGFVRQCLMSFYNEIIPYHV